MKDVKRVAAITQFEDFGKMEEIENGILAEALQGMRGRALWGRRGQVTRCYEMGGSQARS